MSHSAKSYARTVEYPDEDAPPDDLRPQVTPHRTSSTAAASSDRLSRSWRRPGAPSISRVRPEISTTRARKTTMSTGALSPCAGDRADSAASSAPIVPDGTRSSQSNHPDIPPWAARTPTSLAQDTPPCSSRRDEDCPVMFFTQSSAVLVEPSVDPSSTRTRELRHRSRQRSSNRTESAPPTDHPVPERQKQATRGRSSLPLCLPSCPRPHARQIREFRNMVARSSGAPVRYTRQARQRSGTGGTGPPIPGRPLSSRTAVPGHPPAPR